MLTLANGGAASGDVAVPTWVVPSVMGVVFLGVLVRVALDWVADWNNKRSVRKAEEEQPQWLERVEKQISALKESDVAPRAKTELIQKLTGTSMAMETFVGVEVIAKPAGVIPGVGELVVCNLDPVGGIGCPQ